MEPNAPSADEPQEDSDELICRPFITLKSGKRIYAAAYGKKAFCFKPKPRK